MPRVIELRVSADDPKCLEIKVVDPKRITQHGFGLFLENYEFDEIAITDGARRRLAECPYRSGLQGVEVFAGEPRVFAWGCPQPWVDIPFDEISVHRGGQHTYVSQFARLEE